MVRKRKRKLYERIVSVMLTVLMTVMLLPLDLLGGGIAVRAAAYDDVVSKTAGAWSADGDKLKKETTWQMNAVAQSLAQDDTLQGIKIIAKNAAQVKTEQCLSFKPGDIIGIPVDADTESFDLEITLTSANTNRYMTFGDSTVKKVYHNSGNASKTDDDGAFSSKVYTGTGFTRAGYVDSDGYIRIAAGTTDSNDSGENKIGTIVLTEYKTAASGDAVCADLKSGDTVIATITGAHDSSKGFNAMSADKDAIELDAEPQASDFTITAASSNVYSGTSSFTVSVDSGNSKLVVKEGGTEVISIPFTVKGQLKTAAIGTDDNFTFSGQTAGTEIVSAGGTALSADGYIKLASDTAVTIHDGTHGISFTNELTFTVRVPADAAATFTYNDCRFSDANTVSMYVGDASDATETKTSTESGKDGSAVFTYKNTGSSAVALRFVTNGSGTRYIHSISYAVSEIPDEATVSGSVGTAAAGGKLTFTGGGSSYETTVASDGSYSITLPIGNKYDVTLSGASGYEVEDEVDLTSAKKGDKVTKNFTALSWVANKEGKVTIGDTTFVVKSGADKTKDFTITVESGSGRVELAGVETAIVWADYGNKTLSQATTAGTGISAASVADKKVTLTYEDGATNPSGYVLEVRNSGIAEEPIGDGEIHTSSFTDGSILSKMYDENNKLKNTSVTSEDGQITINAASSSGVYYHSDQYGIAMNESDSIDVKVAGNAKVTLTVASFRTTGIQASIKTRAAGQVYVSGDTSKTNTTADTSNQNTAEFSFDYEGDATTLSFAMTGGTSYVKSVAVCNEAPKGTVNESAVSVKPTIVNMQDGALTVTEVGQKLMMDNPNGSTPNTNIESSALGMYVFPATTDNNTLSIDVVVGEGSSNSNAFMLGMFKVSTSETNQYRTVTTAIRSAAEVVQLCSKSDTNVLGKNSFNNAAYSAGDKVRLTITRDGEKVTQTFRNLTAGTEEVSKTTSFNSLTDIDSGDSMQYGIMLSKRTATVTNMLYTKSDGTVLYDQNAYYDPLGSAPTVTSVEAAAASDRTKIEVSWDGNAVYDGKFVLQVKKPGSSEWEDVDVEVTANNYDYMVASDASGSYQFRVCGTLGNSEAQNQANRNTWAESNIAYIKGALETPVLTLPYTSAADTVKVSWTASPEATSYEVYRRYNDNAAVKVATVTGTTYTDTSVSAEVPYYYSVKALSADNFSRMSDEAWTLPTNGHSGDFDENVVIAVTERSYNTVFEGKITLKGVAGAPGTMKLLVNGTEKASATVASANGTFAFTDIAIDGGRNEVELVLEYGNGYKTRKSLNYVYLSNYDYVVDAAFNGTDGAADTNGKPQYKTVQAAIDAVGSSNSSQKIILIRNGEYNEKLKIDTPNISLIGEDSEKTHIHYAVCEGTKSSESDSSRYATTISKTASNFTAENLTFENSWKYDGSGTISNESAEAIYCEAPNSMFAGVRFISNQDTIQAKNSKQYFLRCYVLGNVDFMWGTGSEVLFDDSDFVFRYAPNKNSGYYTAFGSNPYVIYNNSRFTAEEECGGAKYYLGRPYNVSETAICHVAFVDCYMGSIINRDWGYSTWGQKELSTDELSYQAGQYYECGTYGAGYAVNINRRQISPETAADMLGTSGLGWDPYTKVGALGDSYKGSLTLTPNSGTVTNETTTNKYSPYEGDDTGLGKYNLEGFAESSATTGGGTLKESNPNYYKVKDGNEFLTALTTIKNKKGVASVIELTDDILLGYNEVNAASYSSGIIASHNPALLNPVLKASGISKVYIKEMSNLTIFSQNGYSIKHAALDISNSSNVIIRNIKFDELWEWDEDTAGDYDTNDWDYVTIENGSNRVWIDHCTFFKSYDGVVDIKTSAAYATPMNITVSWCEFLPGSEDNIFFNQMMNYLDANKDSNPYYKSLLDSGMSKEQIWWYAYGQKKTHLLGQDDSASANENLHVTFANNHYYDSMDRMPRLRYGTAHVYNCIMDAQELYDARAGITNADAAKHIVSNGASSTCDGRLLVQNSYINGIINALNSGNGSSPSGWINADNSLYYISGVRYKLEPKVNTTKEGEPLKVQDVDSFVEGLPYSGYALYDAAELGTVVKPYAGAGKLSLTVLQWEKAAYIDSTWSIPENDSNYTNDGLPELGEVAENPESYDDDDDDDEEEPEQVFGESTLVTADISELPADILTPEVMLATGCQTIEELTAYLRAFLTGGEHAQEGIFSGIEPDNTLVFDILVKISFDGGHTWVEADESNFPPNGLDVVIPYPEGTDMYNYEFSVGHMFTKNWNGKAPGTMEYIVPEKTMLGIKVHITGASPFVIGWKLITEEENVADTFVSGGSAATGDKVGRLLPLLVYLMLLALVGAAGYMYKTRTASRSRQQ